MTELYLIWSIEHQAWWRADWHGYSETLADAGLYTAAEADRVLTRANRVAVNECRIPVRALCDGAALLLTLAQHPAARTDDPM